MRKMLRFSTVVVLAFLAILAYGVAYGQGSGPTSPVDTSSITDNQVNAIAKQLYCPVCENIPLDVCPTAACEQWRELIRLMLAEGKSEQEIKDYFVLTYGDRVLATPPPNSFMNRLFPFVPWIAFAAGAFVLYRAVKAWRKPAPEKSEGDAVPTAAGDEYVKRLEEELKRR